MYACMYAIYHFFYFSSMLQVTKLPTQLHLHDISLLLSNEHIIDTVCFINIHYQI